jgi:argininosuccinate synthase
MTRIVLAYATSSASCGAVAALRSVRGAEVITVTLDLGQGKGLEALRDRALASGAARAHVLDSREEFARSFQLRALRAGALGHAVATDSSALARLMMALKAVEIARIEDAHAIAHCLGEGAAAPFICAVHSLAPNMDVIALGGGAAEGRPPERPERIDADFAKEPAAIEIAFERGVPIAVNAVEMPLADLIGSLETIAAVHGFGGAAPAADDGGRPALDARGAALLQAAHRALEGRTIGADVVRVLAPLRREYGQLIAEGRWFTPLRDAIDAFIDRVQEQVTGTLRLKLFGGTASTLH